MSCALSGCSGWQRSTATGQGGQCTQGGTAPIREPCWHCMQSTSDSCSFMHQLHWNTLLRPFPVFVLGITDSPGSTSSPAASTLSGWTIEDCRFKSLDRDMLLQRAAGSTAWTNFLLDLFLVPVWKVLLASEAVTIISGAALHSELLRWLVMGHLSVNCSTFSLGKTLVGAMLLRLLPCTTSAGALTAALSVL